MSDERLVTRKLVLARLGFKKYALRQAWSHDIGDAIAFDAWEDIWEPWEGKVLGRYPLRSTGPHYNLAKSRLEPRFGHTLWHEHVDLAKAGKRRVVGLVPVRDTSQNGRARWRAKYVEGHVHSVPDGQVWLINDRTVFL